MQLCCMYYMYMTREIEYLLFFSQKHARELHVYNERKSSQRHKSMTRERKGKDHQKTTILTKLNNLLKEALYSSSNPRPVLIINVGHGCFGDCVTRDWTLAFNYLTLIHHGQSTQCSMRIPPIVSIPLVTCPVAGSVNLSNSLTF